MARRHHRQIELKPCAVHYCRAAFDIRYHASAETCYSHLQNDSGPHDREPMCKVHCTAVQRGRRPRLRAVRQIKVSHAVPPKISLVRVPDTRI
jgi:hypothetical protein